MQKLESPAVHPVLAPGSLPLADLAERFRRSDLVVQVASPSEYDEVEAVARAANPADIFMPLTAGLLKWFLHANPSGPGFLVVARPAPGGPIVGHFLFYATTLVQGAGGHHREIPAHLYVHLYVSPEYRRRGVFARMFAFGLAVLDAMRVPFAYTVPNPRSSPGFVKFGVPLLGTLPCRMAPAWPAWSAVTALTAWPGAGGVTVQRVERFDESIPLPPGSSPLVRGLRTPARLNWRFPERPDAEYAVWRVDAEPASAGYIVTRLMPIQKYRVLVICDLALEPFEAGTLRQAIGAIRGQLRGERIDLVMLQGGPADAAARSALRRAGLLRVPDRLLPQPVSVFGGAPGQPGSTAGLPRLDGWCLTPYDWDVF